MCSSDLSKNNFASAQNDANAARAKTVIAAQAKAEAMVSKQTTIINATGLHARPASVFVTEAKKYQSNVTIKNVDKDSAPVNAKSIMMILAAGLGTGTKIEIACDGADEQAALDALVALVDSGFGE